MRAKDGASLASSSSRTARWISFGSEYQDIVAGGAPGKGEVSI